MLEKKDIVKKLIPVISIILTSGLLILYEYQFGFVIPENLPDDPINNIGDFTKGFAIYNNSLATQGNVSDWVMEGPGEVSFADDWMTMNSPNEEFHHVFWCPEDFPNSFIAQWKVQNLEIDAGLCILFFATTSLSGGDIFDSTLSERTGIFDQYTWGLNGYHISYYANGKNEPGREVANMRKNSGFNLVQNGRAGIPLASIAIHTITLVKDQHHIVMFIDSREIINWIDTGLIDMAPHTTGKIGFRQMKWTNFRYCNFTIWSLANESTDLPAVSPISISSLLLVIIGIISLISISTIIYIVKRKNNR